MEVPRIEGEAEPAELGEALAELRIEQALGRNRSRHEPPDDAVVPRGAVAHAAEAPAAGADLGFEDVAHAPAEHQVGPADDRLADARRAVVARRAHGRGA